MNRAARYASAQAALARLHAMSPDELEELYRLEYAAMVGPLPDLTSAPALPLPPLDSVSPTNVMEPKMLDLQNLPFDPAAALAESCEAQLQAPRITDSTPGDKPEGPPRPPGE